MSLVFLSCETGRVGVRMVDSRFFHPKPEVSVKDAALPFHSHFPIICVYPLLKVFGACRVGGFISFPEDSDLLARSWQEYVVS
jgi:hypothetical protein